MKRSDKKLIKDSIVLSNLRIVNNELEVEIDITETVKIIQSKRPELTRDQIVEQIKRVCKEKGLPIYE